MGSDNESSSLGFLSGLGKTVVTGVDPITDVKRLGLGGLAKKQEVITVGSYYDT